jgi:hypothetical protein
MRDACGSSVYRDTDHTKNNFILNSDVYNINSGPIYNFHQSSSNFALCQKGVHLTGITVFLTVCHKVLKKLGDNPAQL